MIEVRPCSTPAGAPSAAHRCVSARARSATVAGALLLLVVAAAVTAGSGAASRLRIEPLLPFLDPAQRAFWPYLLGATALATGVWLTRARGRGSLPRFLFPRGVWLHRSALLDYRLAFIRALLAATLLAPLVIPVHALALNIARLLWRQVGILPAVSLSDATVLIAFSVTAFVAEDFARFVVHRLAHRVPALWELHKVHHSAEVLTPMTVYRTHPIESLIMRAGAALSLAVTAGLFLWVFPGRLRAWEIGGVYGLSYLWNLLGSNLRHSHVWLSYGRLLEHVFISPAQHQIHHSDQRRHHDRNFGAALAIWDWLGGSLYVTRGPERLTFGLPAAVKNHDDRVVSVLGAPLVAALRRLAVPRRRGAGA